MKKIFLIFALTSLFASRAVMAEENTITVEGEAYSASDISVEIVSDTGTSGGSALKAEAEADVKNPEIVYEIPAEESGVYSFTVATSQMKKSATSDYYIEINGVQRLYPDNAVVGSYISSFCDGIYTYSYPDVNLKKGRNTLKIIIESSDRTNSGKITAAFDCFKFEKKDAVFAPASFEMEDNCFYSSDDILLNVRFNGFAETDTDYFYIVQDGAGVPHRMKPLTVKKGSDTALIDLSGISVGWYRVRLYTEACFEFTGLEACITVTDPVENVPDITATDFAASYLMDGSIAKFLKLEKRLEKAGISNVRDRASWRTADGDYTQKDNFRRVYKNDGIAVNDVYEHSKSGKRDFSENLMDIYEMNRLQSSNGADGTLYEIWNEADGSYALSTGDMYASYFKAAAIGISDGNKNASKAMCGFAYDADVLFTKILMQNEVISYADAYIHHVHTKYSPYTAVNNVFTSAGRSHIMMKNAYDETLPAYLNEAGFNIDFDLTNDKSKAAQAAFYITQLAQMSDVGDDRIYFFTWPYYEEGNAAFGVFEENLEPKPVFSTIAAANRAIGAAKYAGRLANLPDNTEGYMFSDGENDIALVWGSTDSRWQFYTEDAVSVMDWQGREVNAYTTSGGLANIKISAKPVIVRFKGLSDLRNYYPQRRVQTTMTKKEYSVGERIVIRQLWSGQDLALAKSKGYFLENGAEQKITVEIYNFNDFAVDAELYIEADGGYEVNADNMLMSIPAKSYKSFNITLSAGEDIVPGETGYVKISGFCDGEKIPASVAQVIYDDSGRTLTPTVSVENAANSSDWSVNNNTFGSVVTKAETENGIIIDYDMPEGSGYAYPTLNVSETDFSGTDGISFDISFGESYSAAKTDVFVYLSDCAYHLDPNDYIAMTSGTRSIYITWKELIKYSGNGVFKPENIRSIAVGLQGGGDVPAYTVENMCGFVSDSAGDKLEKSIYISGIAEGEHYKKLGTVSAIIPDEASAVRILLNGYEYTAWEKDGNTVKADLTGLERGYYSLQITATDDMNRAEAVMVGFYIE